MKDAINIPALSVSVYRESGRGTEALFRVISFGFVDRLLVVEAICLLGLSPDSR
jgi:hypothetical protein